MTMQQHRTGRRRPWRPRRVAARPIDADERARRRGPGSLAVAGGLAALLAGWAPAARAQPAAPAPSPPPANAAPTPADPTVGPDGLTDADRALLDASEVIAVDHKTEGQALRESARAVTVVETKEVRERAADLGEVLSRVPGVQVRRAGGLGSITRFALNGLYDDQVRFFLDSVPLQLAGWGSGIANVPVELIQRADIYRGVVPIALGADALGGAVDLITSPSWVPRAAASLEIGSYGTERGSLVLRTRDTETGLVVGLSGSLDRALNDYPVTVQVADDKGQETTVRVPRFHDAYHAAGGNAEIGLIDHGPVRRAILRLYASRYDKQLQTNLVMKVVYGEASYAEEAHGASADVVIEDAGWQLRAIAGAARRRIAFHDTTDKIYDWYGNVVGDRETLGETSAQPTDQVIGETSLFARVTAERRLGPHQWLRLAVAPTATMRTGQDLLPTDPGVRPAIDAKRDLYTLISGVEHELQSAHDAVQNIAFAKHYAMWTDALDVQTGNVFVPVSQHNQRFGVGDGLRWHLSDGLSVKASYEWAARLPSVDELFGDGKLFDPNLALTPETSHNVNLELATAHDGSLGALATQLDGFWREASGLIIPIPTDLRSSAQNVLHARILGLEGSARWTTPGEWGWIDASATLADQRNASHDGTYGAFEGDRIPNRPWLFGALGATARGRDVFMTGDELSVFASSRYVHWFYRGWESLGRRDSKQVTPTQIIHGLGLTYALRGLRSYAATAEVQNLTDTIAYDSYGSVRPGRAFYLKLGVEL